MITSAGALALCPDSLGMVNSTLAAATAAPTTSWTESRILGSIARVTARDAPAWSGALMPGAYYTAPITTFLTRTAVNCAIRAGNDERRGKVEQMIEVVRRAHGGRLVLTLAVVMAVGAAVLAQSGTGGGARPASAKPYTQWTAYGGGSHSSQYSALSQINKTNVSQLQVAWTYPVTGTVLFNPIVIDNVMYVQGTANAIVALDAATGKEIWTHPNMGGIGARGLNYWESPDRSDRRLLYLNAGNLTAINAQTGETITSFGTNGRVDLRNALWRPARNPLQTSNPGRIFENVIIISLPAQGAGYDSTPADVQAYDVRTGKVLWTFHSIPHPGEFGYDTWPEGAFRTAGGVHNWSELTIDDQRGIAFIPFGTARFDFYGGNRQGANLFANSLVALDARTGKRLWHHQLVHHDLWDFDLPQSPKLLTLRQNGRTLDVVAQATKHGYIFVFDRVTGKPVLPIEERPVPQSDVPGEATWPTQPVPVKPAPFAVQSFTEKDINPFLPQAEQGYLRQRLRNSRNEGLYTPPSLQGSVSMPGHNGGANWGSGAVDPVRGEFYVVSKNMPVMLRLVRSNDEPTAAARSAAARRSRSSPGSRRRSCWPRPRRQRRRGQSATPRPTTSCSAPPTA